MIIETKALLTTPARKPCIDLHDASTSACTPTSAWQDREENHLGNCPFTCTPKALKSCSTLPRFCFTTSSVPTWKRSRAQQPVLLTSWGSHLPLTSHILAPGKQQTSPDCIPRWQTAASAPLNSHTLLALAVSFCSFHCALLVRLLPLDFAPGFLSSAEAS